MKRIALAWSVALVSTAGSLYWSFGLGWLPCDLCWYQRICMYPTFVLLGLALMYRDRRVVRYVLPLTVVGAGIAAFHYLIQMDPGIISSVPGCSWDVPCDIPQFVLMGWITPPLLSCAAFVLISVVLVWRRGSRWG